MMKAAAATLPLPPAAMVLLVPLLLLWQLQIARCGIG